MEEGQEEEKEGGRVKNTVESCFDSLKLIHNPRSNEEGLQRNEKVIV